MRPPLALPGAALAAALLLVSGCASGPSSASKKAINSMLAAQNFEGALAKIEKAKQTQYKKKNMVLFYLDKGMVEHHAGKYKESDASLDAAERRMEELYTKSITKAAGMLVLNDNTVDYAGEPFERALTNVVRALNYVFLGQPDEALVESRKAEQFLQELNDRLGGKSTYKDDAFARYLDSLLYEDSGQTDDARISRHHAKKAYGWYASLYNTPMPKFDLPDDPKGRMGEIVFIHYNGVAPRKVSKTFQVAWGRAVALARTNGEANQKFNNALAAGLTGRAITVAYPKYVQDPFTIASSEVRVASDDEHAAPTLLMEDVSAIAMRVLQERNALIKTRAIARATVKFVLAESASRAAKKACERKYGRTSLKAIACKATTRGLAHGAAAATEAADTRGWSTLPSQIRMARLRVPPGTHTVTVVFKNAAGGVVATKVFEDVEVRRGRRTYLQHRTAA